MKTLLFTKHKRFCCSFSISFVCPHLMISSRGTRQSKFSYSFITFSVKPFCRKRSKLWKHWRQMEKQRNKNLVLPFFQWDHSAEKRTKITTEAKQKTRGTDFHTRFLFQWNHSAEKQKQMKKLPIVFHWSILLFLSQPCVSVNDVIELKVREFEASGKRKKGKGKKRDVLFFCFPCFLKNVRHGCLW